MKTFLSGGHIHSILDEPCFWDNMYVVEKIETYRNSCGANNDVLFFISGLPLQSGGNNL